MRLDHELSTLRDGLLGAGNENSDTIELEDS
jgi:hypothetical protein